RADTAKASLARRTQALDPPMLCRSRQVALPGGGKDKSKTHHAKNLGNRSNRCFLSACDKLTDDEIKTRVVLRQHKSAADRRPVLRHMSALAYKRKVMITVVFGVWMIVLDSTVVKKSQAHDACLSYQTYKLTWTATPESRAGPSGSNKTIAKLRRMR